jgi:hypothetical protein
MGNTEKKDKGNRKKGFVLAGVAVVAAAAVIVALMLTVFDKTPDDVTGAAAGDSTTHTIDISWEAAKKATGYEVTAAPVKGDEIYAVAGKEAPVYPVETEDIVLTLEGLIADEEYVVTVRAFADLKNGERVYQEGEAVETEAKTAAPVLPLLSAPVLTADSPDTVLGAISAVVPEEGAVVYDFYFSAAENGEYEIIETEQPAVSKGELAEQTTYYVYANLVLTLDGKRFVGDGTEKVSVTTQAKPVAPPPAASSGSGSSGNSTPKRSSAGSAVSNSGDGWDQFATTPDGDKIWSRGEFGDPDKQVAL